MKISKLEAWNFSSPPRKRFNFLGPSLSCWFWSKQNFRSPPPSPKIFSGPPFRVSKNFQSPPQYLHPPPSHIKWAFPKANLQNFFPSMNERDYLHIMHANKIHCTYLSVATRSQLSDFFQSLFLTRGKCKGCFHYRWSISNTSKRSKTSVVCLVSWPMKTSEAGGELPRGKLLCYSIYM